MKRTAKATETLMRRTDDRAAERLRGRGWVVFAPETVAKIGRTPVVLEGDPDDGCALPPAADRIPGELPLPFALSELDPCAFGCPDPAAHAEGGHDV
jgi:hypothetical protein